VTITGLGHVVRLHGRLDLDVVTAALSLYREANQFRGYVDDLLSDINIFHQRQGAS